QRAHGAGDLVGGHSVTALYIDRDRQGRVLDNSGGIGERQCQGQPLAIAVAVSRRNRPTAGGNRPRTGCRDCFGTTGVPDIAQDEWSPADMQRMEYIRFLLLTAHDRLLLTIALFFTNEGCGGDRTSGRLPARATTRCQNL